jgi:TPR repeat protein
VKNLIELLVGSGAVQPEKSSHWTSLLEERELFKKWREEAELGDSDSMIKVANAYRSGTHGVRTCYQTATRWYFAAGRKGNKSAYEELKSSEVLTILHFVCVCIGHTYIRYPAVAMQAELTVHIYIYILLFFYK